jgi:hypothetical protein
MVPKLFFHLRNYLIPALEVLHHVLKSVQKILHIGGNRIGEHHKDNKTAFNVRTDFRI